MKKKPLLKQFSQLTQKDFRAHAVWVSCHTMDTEEPWYEETDEETFRPWDGPLPVSPAEGMFLVRSSFTLADGRRFSGFVTPQRQDTKFDLGTIQPQLFLPSGRRVSFWDGMVKRPEKEVNSFYTELQANTKSVFPIRFAAEPSLTNGLAAGSIPGFSYLKGDKVHSYQ